MRALLVAVALTTVACENTQKAEPAEPKPVTFDGALVSDASSKIAHGERLTHVLGCTGCHGKGLQGRRFYELYASNLTRDLRNYSDFEVERVFRQGVPKNGRDLWGMPSEIFQHLSAADSAALIAYLRTLKPAGSPTQPRLPWEPDTQKMIAKGKIKPAAVFVRESHNLGPIDIGANHALGRYITRVTCAECHGPELKGGDDTPDLIVAGGYTRDEFERLLTTGVPTGGRKLNPMMEGVAKTRFAYFTPRERDALFAYLKARAER